MSRGKSAGPRSCRTPGGRRPQASRALVLRASPPAGSPAVSPSGKAAAASCGRVPAIGWGRGPGRHGTRGACLCVEDGGTTRRRGEGWRVGQADPFGAGTVLRLLASGLGRVSRCGAGPNSECGGPRAPFSPVQSICKGGGASRPASQALFAGAGPPPKDASARAHSADIGQRRSGLRRPIRAQQGERRLGGRVLWARVVLPHGPFLCPFLAIGCLLLRISEGQDGGRLGGQLGSAQPYAAPGLPLAFALTPQTTP